MDEDVRGLGSGAPPWSAPEAAAVAVLSAVGVLALGGLAMGIDVAATSASPFPATSIVVWDSITYGASWAGPVLAMALLAVAGVCWWQADRWADDAAGNGIDGTEDTEGTDDLAGERARWYVARAVRLAVWDVAALALVTAAAVALVVAVVGIDAASHAGQPGWARLIGVAAEALAVVVVSACGVAVARSTQRIGASLP